MFQDWALLCMMLLECVFPFLCSRSWLKTPPSSPRWIRVSERPMWTEWMKVPPLRWTIILPLGLEFLNILQSRKKVESALDLKDLSVLKWSLPASQMSPPGERAAAGLRGRVSWLPPHTSASPERRRPNARCWEAAGLLTDQYEECWKCVILCQMSWCFFQGSSKADSWKQHCD